jgi:hypothetical protein
LAQSNTEKQARLRAIRGSVLPKPSDIERVERQYGRLPRGATIEQRAYRWRLCVAEALRRLAYEDPVLDKVLRRRRRRQRS